MSASTRTNAIAAAEQQEEADRSKRECTQVTEGVEDERDVSETASTWRRQLRPASIDRERPRGTKTPPSATATSGTLPRRPARVGEERLLPLVECRPQHRHFTSGPRPPRAAVSTSGEARRRNRRRGPRGCGASRCEHATGTTADEAQRWVEQHRLAVHTGRDRSCGAVDLERLGADHCRHTGGARAGAPATRLRERCNAQQPLVDPWSGAGPSERPSRYGVVGDEDDGRRVVRVLAIGRRPLQRPMASEGPLGPSMSGSRRRGWSAA